MLARRRSYLFLGGALSSAISVMLVLRLGTWLMGSGQFMAFQMELYLGLLVFVGYVLFDTQVSSCLNLIPVARLAHAPPPPPFTPLSLMSHAVRMHAPTRPYVDDPRWCPQLPCKMLWGAGVAAAVSTWAMGCH